jgi:hypothetical protein
MMTEEMGFPHEAVGYGYRYGTDPRAPPLTISMVFPHLEWVARGF